MKKIYSILLVLVFLFVLAGCGPKVTISLNEEDKAITLTEGESKTVTPVVTGEAELVWESSNPEIASVENGKVNALKPGNATVKIIVKDNEEIFVEFIVKVLIDFQLSVTETEVVLEEGEDLTIYPTYTVGATLVWESSNSEVATVVDGKITAVKEGTAEVKVYLQEKTSDVKTINVTVNKKVYLAENVNIQLEKFSAYIGDEIAISANVLPAEAAQEVEWSFSPAEAVSFADGKLTALQTGAVTIRATAKDGTDKYAEATLNIYNVITDFTISGKEKMNVNSEQLLTITIATENAKDEFIWTSSDETIATVDEIGFVTTLAEGTVTIKAVAADSGQCEKTFTITVIEQKLKLNDTVYATFAEALAAAQDGDTIYLPSGTIADAFTVSINNLTISGPNAGIHGATGERDAEAIFEGKITVAANVTGFTVDGCAFNAAGAITLEEGVSNLTVQYCTYGQTKQDGVVRGPDKGEVTNIRINYNYSEGFTSYRFGHFNDIVNGLELIGNELNCSSCYDMLNIAGTLKGTVIVKDNKFVNSLQSFLYVKGVGVLDCTIQGNYIDGMTQTIIDFRDMKEDGAVKVVIFENEFLNSGSGWMPIRIRTAGYDANDTLSIEVKDNKFIDSCTSSNEFMNNPSFETQSDPFKAIYTVGKNYYEISGVALTEVTNANFRDSAISIEGVYATEAEVPGFENAE